MPTSCITLLPIRNELERPVQANMYLVLISLSTNFNVLAAICHVELCVYGMQQL